MKRLESIWICLLFLPFMVHSQELRKNPAYIGVKSHYGFIIPHSVALKDATDSNPAGIELTWGKILLQQDQYALLNNFAKTGMTFHWIDFRKPGSLGHSLNLGAFVEPVFMFRNRLHFSVKNGMGATWLTRVYDEENNPDNKFFATRISFLLYVNPSIHYRAAGRLNLILSGSYNHISNGGIRQPNYGMNFPTLAVGAEYVLKDYTIPDYPLPKANALKDRRISVQADLFASVKNIDRGNNFENDGLIPDDTFEAMLLWIYGIQLRASKPVSERNTLSLSVEWIADHYTRERIRRAGLNLGYNKAAILGGHEFVFGKAGFRQQLAFYLHAPFEKDIMYQRYTLYYNISQRYCLSTSLKAHLHQADIFDIRIGLRF